MDIIGQISQRKREPLSSDLEIQLGYTLVGVVLNTFSETPIQPTFLSEEPILSSFWTYSQYFISISRIPFPLNQLSLIIKTDQDTLQNISISAAILTPFGTDLSTQQSYFYLIISFVNVNLYTLMLYAVECSNYFASVLRKNYLPKKLLKTTQFHH